MLCRPRLSLRCIRLVPLCWLGESTTDHLDILDDNPVEQEDPYPFEHHYDQPKRAHAHPRQPPSNWAEQGNGGGEASIPTPWDDDGGASTKLSRLGRAEGRRIEENWEGGGAEGEGRAWKHEDLKQLLQVCRPKRLWRILETLLGGMSGAV